MKIYKIDLSLSLLSLLSTLGWIYSLGEDLQSKGGQERR
jgi:hypothetical protein